MANISVSTGVRPANPSKSARKNRSSIAHDRWAVLLLFLPPALILFTLFVIMPMGELSIGQLLAPALARLSRNVRPIIRSASIELMRELAERGIGIAFQTRVGLDKHIAEKRLVHIPLDAGGPIWSDLGVYVRAGRALPATLDLALHILADELREREAADGSVPA